MEAKRERSRETGEVVDLPPCVQGWTPAPHPCLPILRRAGDVQPGPGTRGHSAAGMPPGHVCWGTPERHGGLAAARQTGTNEPTTGRLPGSIDLGRGLRVLSVRGVHGVHRLHHGLRIEPTDGLMMNTPVNTNSVHSLRVPTRSPSGRCGAHPRRQRENPMRGPAQCRGPPCSTASTRHLGSSSCAVCLNVRCLRVVSVGRT